jgi:hypothetical protein
MHGIAKNFKEDETKRRLDHSFRVGHRFRRGEGIMRKSHEHVIPLRSVNGPIDQTLIEAIAGGSQVAMRTLYDGSASCETRTEEGSVDPGSETNKRQPGSQSLGPPGSHQVGSLHSAASA